MQWIRSRLTFANVTSMIALFVALGGTSYALAANSIGAREIKKNGVKASEIARNAVGASEVRSNSVAGGDVADGTIGSLDIGDNAITGSELAANSVGAGETAANSVGSEEVVNGSLGATDLVAGLLDHTLSATVQRTDVALADNTTGAAEASCPAGSTAIGGGASVDQTSSDDIKLMVSRPGNGGFIPDDGQAFNDWRAVYRNPAGGTGAAEIRAFVICVEIH